MGGAAVQQVGVEATYAACGAMFAALGAATHAFIEETQARPSSPAASAPPAADRALTDRAPVSSSLAHASSSSLAAAASAPSLTAAAAAVHATAASAQAPSAVAPPSPPPPPGPPSGVLDSFAIAFRAWSTLSRDPALRDLSALNACYWAALAGVQMTVLPLYMVSPALGMGPGQIGAAFAIMSASSVLVSQPVAYVADKVGKVRSATRRCFTHTIN